MLSAFILVDPSTPHFDGDRSVVKTLAALVPLVVSGVVADATIVTRPLPSIARLESIAGCAIVERAALDDALVAALPAARRENALILVAGYAPDTTFTTEVEPVLERRENTALALLAMPETILERLFPSRAPAVGLVTPLAALAGVAHRGGHSVALLRKSLAARSMRTKGILA